MSTNNDTGTLNITEKDFELASEFHDVCPKCRKASDDYKYIVIDEKEYFKCPKCGHINN